MNVWQSKHAGWVVCIALICTAVVGTWLVDAGATLMALAALGMALGVTAFALVLITREEL